MNIEALKEAHDLSLDGRDFAARQIILDVIANLEKEALAQPEQEPLTENGMYRLGYHNGYGFGEAYGKANAPQRKPLTDERVSFEAYTIDPGDWNDLRLKFAWHKGFNEGARAIEAAHGIKDKNTRGKE